MTTENTARLDEHVTRLRSSLKNAMQNTEAMGSHIGPFVPIEDIQKILSEKAIEDLFLARAGDAHDAGTIRRRAVDRVIGSPSSGPTQSRRAIFAILIYSFSFEKYDQIKDIIDRLLEDDPLPCPRYQQTTSSHSTNMTRRNTLARMDLKISTGFACLFSKKANLTALTETLSDFPSLGIRKR
ncbi:hypothetical protein EJ04DRAFT_578109 [Polyplosphaeria fusca]|uniref:Uncharacterized protein n=1 Tax=Polyplosphaeria fusca TaxID=682080 RepID=A0A9P4QXB5_9PLEO|nr:hypothetical protein EJ04DRAFT_578109 [Polyplosphaeria fusca]